MRERGTIIPLSHGMRNRTKLLSGMSKGTNEARNSRDQANNTKIIAASTMNVHMMEAANNQVSRFGNCCL